MTARVAFIGDSTPATMGAAVSAVRKKLRNDFVALVYLEAELLHRSVTVSRFARSACAADPTAARDAEMVADAALVIAFDERALAVARSHNANVWTTSDCDRVLAQGEAPLAREEAPMTQKDDAPVAHEFIWLDLETTGLDPHEGLLLEFAAVLCEDHRGDDFAVVQQYTGVVHHSAEAINAVAPDQAVIKMHRENGLWDDVLASTTTLAEVDGFLAALAESLTPRKRVIVLAGSSVHFDRRWCDVHLPRFAAYLSHRVFDVTTVRRVVDAYGPATVWPYRDSHRALADVLATIAEARCALRALGL
jgi:oligoribonuclease